MAGSPDSKGRAAKAPFLAFAMGAQDEETLKAFATEQGWSDSCVMQGDIGTATEFLRHHTPPEVLLVEIPSTTEEAATFLDQLADVCDPNTKVITVGTVNEYSFFCWLMDLGISSYLLKPLSLGALQSAFAKINEPEVVSAKAEKKLGTVIGLLGTRGGSGVTTMAIHLAALFAEQSKKDTALIDLDPQDGSISLMLDLEPSRGLKEALERPDRIDLLFLDRVMLKSRDHLMVMSAEESLGDNINPHEDAANTLFTALREKFSVIIVDLPRSLTPFNRRCLGMCDQVLIVSDATLQGLRDALRLNDFFRDNLKAKKPHFVVNRVGMMPKYEVSQNDFEKNLNGKLTARIPYAPDVIVESGADLKALKHMHSPVMKSLNDLAKTLLPEMYGEEAPAEDKKASKLAWLKKGK